MSIGSGDIVQLKSGGPLMTAGKKRGYNTHIDCYWFDGDELCIQTFPISALVEVPEVVTKERAG